MRSVGVIDDEFLSHCAPLYGYCVVTGENGGQVQRGDDTDDAVYYNRTGAGVKSGSEDQNRSHLLAVSRTLLHQSLLTACLQKGAKVHYNMMLTAVERDSSDPSRVVSAVFTSPDGSHKTVHPWI